MTDKPRDILPEERLHPASPRALACLVAAALLGGLLFNAAVVRLFEARPDLGNPTYGAFDAQWQRLLALDAPVQTLILGDSSGRHGIDPAVLDAELGTRSLNLCTIGNAGVVNAAWQLEAYLARHPAPERVVFMAVHDLWKREIEAPLIPWIPLPWGFWNDMRVTVALDREQTRDAFLTRHVPVYSQDRTVTELLMHPWRAGQGRVPFRDSGYSPIWKPDPQKARDDFRGHLKWTVPGGWQLSDQSRAALRAMVAMADEHGFRLYLASSPQLDAMVAHPDVQAYLADGRWILGEIIGDREHVRLVLDPPVGFPADVMQNSDHITREAVPAFTRELAGAIAEVEGRS